MKIGFMARTIDALDGPGVGTLNLLDSLLQIDQRNEYVIFYRTIKHYGRYSKYPNAKELLIKMPHKILWDQIAIPYISWREGIDVIFHPKFTVPLLTSKPTIMTMRGSEWYTHPEFYSWFDILYVKLAMPVYGWKATKVICITNIIKQDSHKYIGIPNDKMITIHNAANKDFKVINNENKLNSVRRKYNLPEKFILTVSRAYHLDLNTKKTYAGKNLDGIIDAFLVCRKTFPCNIVITGKNVKEYLETTKGRKLGKDDGIYFTGYVEQDELPFLYNLAELFLFPSFYEGFPIPPAEAMACGCPVVTSRFGGCLEVTGDAAISVDPNNTDEIADSILNILSDDHLRRKLRNKSLARSRDFSWDKTAKNTLTLIESI